MNLPSQNILSRPLQGSHKKIAQYVSEKKLSLGSVFANPRENLASLSESQESSKILGNRRKFDKTTLELRKILDLLTTPRIAKLSKNLLDVLSFLNILGIF